MSVKNKLSGNRWQIFLSVGLVGLFMLFILLYGFNYGIRLTTKYVPLMDAALEMKIEVTTAHLWFEEIISGDKSENINEVWKHLENADWYANAMLVGGKKSKTIYKPFENEENRRDINQIRLQLAEFVEITQKRLEERKKSIAGTEIDRLYDAAYKDIINQIDQVEKRIDHFLSNDLRQFKIAGISLIITSILLTIFVGIILIRYEKRRQADIHAMEDINNSLQVEIEDREQAKLLQSVIFQISEAAHNTKSLNLLYESIHKILGQILDVTNFYIAQYDDKTKLLSFPFDMDSEDEFPTTARPLGNGITEYMIKTGEPLLISKNDIEEYKRQGKFEAVGALSEQWMGSPLIVKNKTIGVIAVNSYQDPNLYTESDLKILTFVAEQVAQAIEHKQSITDLEVEKTYLNELFTYSPEALALVTTDSIVLHINEQFSSLFGYKEDEVFGRNIDDLLVPTQDKKKAQAYTKEVALGKRMDFETIRKKKDGSKVNVSVLSSPVNYKGDVLAVYAVYRDITERIKAAEIIKKSEEQDRSQSIELSESNSMKEMLLDVIAHDLRNPAGVIKGFAEFGLEMDPNNEILKEIDGGVDNLLNVISDATTLSKVALGDKITKEELDIVSIIKIAIDENKSQLEFADMKLEFEMRKKLKVMVNPIICEVFRNYISNAIKYAQAGKKIVIDTIVEDDYVTINVQDFGKTIKQEDRENIFMRNVQLGKTKGRGLGLAIVKRIADAHGALVGVNPNDNKGNVFYLKLPLAS